MARLMALALLGLLPLLAGCGSEERVDVSVDFRVTGAETSEQHELACDPPGGTVPDAASACEELAENDDLYFPEDEGECPLPVPTTYLVVTGTHGDEELQQTIAPCSDEEGRAVDAWAALLGFVPPPFERR